jgi:ABC-type nitrate/sulfonate/bicarbonate transport system ATPase subunit
VLIDGRALERRLGEFAFMPQRDALLPWRRTIDNVTIGLELAGVARARARERARPLLERFGLGGFEAAWPWQLSGGMRSRAAFLRTVLLGKPAMLLDEPFGALDGITRSELQQWLLEVWTEVGSTVALITHDVAEAVFLADRVYVMTPRPGAHRRGHRDRPAAPAHAGAGGVAEVRRARGAPARAAARADRGAAARVGPPRLRPRERTAPGTAGTECPKPAQRRPAGRRSVRSGRRAAGRLPQTGEPKSR